MFEPLFGTQSSCHKSPSIIVHCKVTFELASIVPHWSERFDYHGFALDSDDYDNPPADNHINIYWEKLLK